jgi:hypothetical protein
MLRVVLRIIAILLILNGVAGLVAVWLGQQLTGEVLADAREASARLAPAQAQMVSALNDVAVTLADAASAADGVAASMGRARVAIGDSGQAAGALGTSFAQMAPLTRAGVAGVRPLEGLAEPFAEAATSFQRLSGSLNGAADSLGHNAREAARVAEDLRAVRGRVEDLAGAAAALRPRALAREGLSGLEFGMRVALAWLLL